MKKLIVLILSLILCISMFGCSGSEQSTLDKYVSELGLKDSWVTTMEEHIPEFDTLESIEANGTQGYKVTMSGGESYYVVIDAKDEVACIMTTEEDYDARTRLYDAYK